MRTAISKRLTPAQRTELKLLDACGDDQIDTSDACELLDWSDAKRGMFYTPSRTQ